MFGPPRVLLHEKKSVDLAPLRSVGAALFNHNPDRIVGRLSEIDIRDDRKGIARITFDADEEGERAFSKVQSGSLRGVSVRFSVQKAQLIGEREEWTSPDGQTFRGGDEGLEVATRWTPREISLTPIPADVAVGVGRGETRKETPMKFTEEILKRLKARGLDPEGFTSEDAARATLDALDKADAARSDPPADDPPADDPPADPKPADVSGEIRKAIDADRKRTATLMELADNLGDPSRANKWIKEATSLEDVRKEVITELASRNPTPHYAPLERGHDQRDKILECATGAMLLRGGQAYKRPDDFKEEIPHSIKMAEAARLLCEARGMRFPQFAQATDYIRAALSHASGDFPLLLSNVASKSMQQGFVEAQVTYPVWTTSRQTSDFKVADRPQIGEIQDFELVPDGMPLPESTISEKGGTVQLNTYGRKFVIGRQAFINDDQGAFTRMAALFGAAGNRTINTDVYALLAIAAGAGPNLTEGAQTLSLFNATWASGSNLQTSSALTGPNLGAARALMMQQLLLTASLEAGAVTPSTGRLNVSPSFLLVPAALVQTADEIVNGSFVPITEATAITSFQRQLTVVADAQLDAISATDWYVSAAPGAIDFVEVTRLAGQSGPEFMQLDTGDALGFAWAGFVDYDVTALEHRGAVKSEA